MLSLNKNWNDAIKKRRSRRNYKELSIEKDKIDTLMNLALNINKSQNGVNIHIISDIKDNIFKGISAPAAVVFSGNMSDNNIYTKIGYYGEMIILESTLLELGTCWLGRSYNKNLIKSLISIKDNEDIFAISPLGYPTDRLSLKEIIVYKMVKHDKRKEIDEICEDVKSMELSDWVMFGLENVKYAPSALNKQPWKFNIDGNTVVVSLEGKRRGDKYSKTDCGIAMLHFELGALKELVEGKWEFLDNNIVGKFSTGRE